MFNRQYLKISLMTLILALGAAACGPFAGTTSPTATPGGESNPSASTPAGVAVGGQSTPAAPAATATSAPTSAPAVTPGGIAIGQSRAIKNVSSGLDKLKSYRAHAMYSFDGKDKNGKASTGSLDFLQEVINSTQDDHTKITFTGNPIGANSDTGTTGTPGAYETYRVGGNLYVINQGTCQYAGSGSSTPVRAAISADTLINVDKATLVGRLETVNGVITDHYTFTEAALGTSLNGMKLTQGDAWIALDGYVVRMTAQASGTTTNGAQGTVNFSYGVDNINNVQPIVQPAECVAPTLATDVPIPPNATEKQVLAAGGQSLTTFKSPDPIKTIADFYRQAMPAQGWKPAGDNANGAISIQLTYTKDAGKRMLMINLIAQGIVSNVIITDKTTK